MAQPNPKIKRVENPPSRFQPDDIEWIDEPPKATLEVFEEEAKSILSKNDSPDIGFTYSVNAYRGCFHGCAYCYARPSHQYLDFGSGSDFERKLVVKVNAPELLNEAFEKRSWEGELIVFSGNTDCYQPLESTYCLTRRCLEVCARYRNPVGLITKGALVRRDKDVLQDLARNAEASVAMSIAFVEDEMSRKIEPGAPRPSVRFRAMKELSDAGVPVSLALAPVIPGLNDSQIPSILERAAECGARNAFMTLLRLPLEVKDVFTKRLHEEFPTRANKVLHQVQDMRNGALYRADWGNRMTGQGERWKAIEWIFEQQCERLGINRGERTRAFDYAKTFKRPTAQLGLFEQ